MASPSESATTASEAAERGRTGRRKRPARGARVDDPRCRQPGSADGGAGRDRGDHRAALGAAGSGVHQRVAAVDRHRVRPGLRLAAAGRRTVRGPVRAPDRAGRRPGGVRGGLRAGRDRAERRRADRRPRTAGPVRRAARAGRAERADHHLHPSGGAEPGVRRLRRGGRRRRRDRAAARRAADRVPELALDAVHQPGHRGRGAARRAGVRPEPPAGGPPDPGPARYRAGLFRLVLAGVRFLASRGEGLELAAVLGQPVRRLRPARRLRLVAEARDTPAASAARAGRTQPRRVLPRDVRHRCGHVRRLPVPDLLPAA